MGIVIGIDVGGSITKIVGLLDDKIIGFLKVKATDAITSTFGGFGKFITDNKINIKDIKEILITGVGSTYIKDKIYDIPTYMVDEFTAIGYGGLMLSSLSKAIIVSMGTGTAFISASEDKIEHIGGTGVGGGTLLGLSRLMLNMDDFNHIIELANDGDLNKIDLSVNDITKSAVSNLSPETTASNFGKISDLAEKSDIALGIINLIFQSIGMLSVFACKSSVINDVVLTGNLTQITQAKTIFDTLNKIYKINFIIPKNAEFSTALGAAIISNKNIKKVKL
ncbi:MAG: type II pantothenate kinase [Clostridia bacterium]